MKNLTFTDLAVLAAIRWRERSQFESPTRNDLMPPGGLINIWREEYGVDRWHMMPLTSVYTTSQIFDSLWDSGFIQERNNQVSVTTKGQWLLDQVGPEWSNWPLEFSIDSKGRIITESAVY